MKLESLTINIDHPLTIAQIGILQELVSWLVAAQDLETDEYTISGSDDPDIAFVAVPVDGSSLCHVISSCGRFVYAAVLCSNCGFYVRDEEIMYREECSAQLCDECYSARDD